MPLEHIAHGLIGDIVAEIRQRAGDLVVAPVGILVDDFED